MPVPKQDTIDGNKDESDAPTNGKSQTTKAKALDEEDPAYELDFP